MTTPTPTLAFANAGCGFQKPRIEAVRSAPTDKSFRISHLPDIELHSTLQTGNTFILRSLSKFEDGAGSSQKSALSARNTQCTKAHDPVRLFGLPRRNL